MHISQHRKHHNFMVIPLLVELEGDVADDGKSCTTESLHLQHQPLRCDQLHVLLRECEKVAGGLVFQ